MVYGGKPSLGCKECKRRRIKCDERKPTCFQCEKSRRQCPGYLSKVDVMFRNQTDLVTRRATKNKSIHDSKQPAPVWEDTISFDSASTASRNIDRETSTSIISPGTSVDEEVHRDVAIIGGAHAVQAVKLPYYLESSSDNPSTRINFWLHKGPTLPLADQAVAIFFRHLAEPGGLRNNGPRSWLQYLTPMYSEAAENTPIRLAAGAAAVAALSKRPDTLSLRPLAVDLYSRAIQSVHRALQDPKQNKADDTLAASVLLSLYECASPMDADVQAWSSHVNGAAAIVRTRGNDILSTPRSLALFRVTRSQMITNCIRGQTCPAELPIEGGWLADIKYLPDPSYSLAKNVFDIPQLFVRGRKLLAMPLTADIVSQIEAVIDEAFALDQRMRDWRPLQSGEWHPRTVSYTLRMPEDLKNAESWIGPVYEWQSMHTAAIMNKQRAAQMSNANLIIECFKKINPERYESDPRYRKACYILQSNLDEICYSVPFFFGHGVGPERKKLYRSGNGMMEAIGAYHLIWPVSVAYGCPMISDAQREWLGGRIDVISVHYGLGQAIVVREIFLKNLLSGNLMGV